MHTDDTENNDKDTVRTTDDDHTDDEEDHAERPPGRCRVPTTGKVTSSGGFVPRQPGSQPLRMLIRGPVSAQRLLCRRLAPIGVSKAHMGAPDGAKASSVGSAPATWAAHYAVGEPIVHICTGCS